MLKFVVISALVATACAYGNAGYGGRGAGGFVAGSGGYGGAGGFGAGAGAGAAIVAAAINSRHNVNFVDVPTVQNLNPATVEIGASQLPVTIVFRSSSSALNIQQAHDGAAGTVQESSSEDEPHRLVHRVTKPIIQEVHEVIQPMRKIQQEVLPVQEEVLTLVARDSGFAGGANLGAGFGAGFGGAVNTGLGGAVRLGGASVSAGASAGKAKASGAGVIVVSGKSAKSGY